MSKELLQQALAALEEHQYKRTNKAMNMGENAIKDLRAAIAQPKQPAKTKLGTIGHTAYAGFGPMTDAFFLTQISQPEQPAPQNLQKRLADLHLYEEINEHYAKCNPGPGNLRDWVAERINSKSAVKKDKP